MVSLSDPVGYGEDEEGPEWTPGRGLVRAAVHGAIATVLLAAVLSPAAWYVPLLTMHWGLGAAIAFGVAWILFGVVQRAAGMVGAAVTALAIVFTLLVLISQNAIVAVHGIPTSKGVIASLAWISPVGFVVSRLASFVTVAFCAALRHDGGADGETLGWILRLPVLGRLRER